MINTLTVAFIVLKLMEIIDWSWWLVISPLYIYVAMFVFPLVLLGLINVAEYFRKDRTT